MVTEEIDGDAVARRNAAVKMVRGRSPLRPDTALILGSGLGRLADQIQNATTIPFSAIPGCSHSTASGHRGELILGTLAGKPIVAMAGRLHRYEGWSNDEVVFPVHLMAALGARNLIVSNAAGGVNPKLHLGEIVIIRDHIDWIRGCYVEFPTAAHPLTRGDNLYDAGWSELAMHVALKHRFHASEGTYLATLGPNYETRAEYRMMRKIGADVVGMSTVPEVLAANSLKMRVLGLSMVSNVANPDRPSATNHTEVLEAGRAAEVKMEALVRAALTGDAATGA